MQAVSFIFVFISSVDSTVLAVKLVIDGTQDLCSLAAC